MFLSPRATIKISKEGARLLRRSGVHFDLDLNRARIHGICSLVLEIWVRFDEQQSVKVA